MEQASQSNRSILIALAIGVWIIVFQNLGVIPVFFPQTVAIKGPTVIKGKVEIENGSKFLNVNLKAINGNPNAFYMDDDGEYILLPIIDRQKKMYVTD